MKIHQIPLGARFEYEGEEFTKTGPMFGTGKDGRQTLIPKYAPLKVLDDTVRAKKEAVLAKAEVLAAFNKFYATCETLASPDRQADLSAARQRFLKSLGMAT